MNDYKEYTLRFLKNNHLAVVGTVSKTGEPQLATLLYLMDDDFNLYFVTYRDTRKCANLENNSSKVGIAIASDKDGREEVQVQGKAEPLKESSKEFIDKLDQWINLSTLYYGSFLKVTSSRIWIFKVKPEWLRYMSIKDGGEEYHQIIAEGRFL